LEIPKRVRDDTEGKVVFFFLKNRTAMRLRRYYVYILTNARNTVLYIGMTNDIMCRMTEHKAGTIEGFSRRYDLKKLIYLEEFAEVREAIAREKQLKNWHREWKLNLIRQENPEMEDLSASWFVA
jgi:putative endonuclease